MPKFFSLSPFDGAKFDALLGGLAITICKNSALENIQTIGSEYYLPDYVRRQSLVRASSATVERLASICSLITDGDHGVADYQDEGIQFVLSGNVKEGWIDTSDIRNISDEHHATLKRSSLKCGDVLVTKTGVYFGNSAVVPEKFGEANTIAHVGILRLKEAWNPYYVSTFLNSSYGYAQLRRRGMKATRPEIKLIEFNDIEIPFFGKIFEQGIYDLLQKAGQARDLANQHYTRTEDALLVALGLADWKPPEPLSYIASSTEAFAAGRLDAQYFRPKFDEMHDRLKSIGGDLSLSDALSLNARGRQPQYEEIGLPVINSKHVRTNRVILSSDNRFGIEEGSPILIQKGDVLLNGTGVGTIGRAAPYMHAAKALPDNHVTVLRPKTIDPIYLSVFLNSQLGQMQIERFISGSSGQIELYPSDIAKIVVWDAPENVQLDIRGAILSAFDQERRAQDLLDRAKRAVEIAIEDSEAAALRYLEEAEA